MKAIANEAKEGHGWETQTPLHRACLASANQAGGQQLHAADVQLHGITRSGDGVGDKSHLS